MRVKNNGWNRPQRAVDTGQLTTALHDGALFCFTMVLNYCVYTGFVDFYTIFI